MLEIERKFLVASVPANLARFSHSDIVQGYLALEPGRSQVRIRRQRDESAEASKHELTVKTREGAVRDEINVDLSSVDFERLWPLTDGRRLHKTRYRIAHGDRTIEIDVFHGAKEGLILAEIEFDSEEQCHAFVPPDWLGKEVTSDPTYSNVRLAGG